MRSIRLAYIAALLALGGCTTSATVATAPVVSTAQADVTKALGFYQTAKGIALVAEIAQPQLKPYVDATVARLDPIAATIQAGAPTAGGIASQTATLVDEAVALEQQVAATVRVVAAK